MKKINAKTEKKISWRKLKAGLIPIIHLIIFIHGSALLSLSVVRGSISGVSHNSARQTSRVEVSAARVYWQRGGVFERQAAGPLWRGHILTLLQCHVKPGDGEFLFMGSEHFGEAWLGCAPRYKDFLSVYKTAWAARRNSCDFPLD